jgi:hypothetical protein
MLISRNCSRFLLCECLDGDVWMHSIPFQRHETISKGHSPQRRHLAANQVGRKTAVTLRFCTEYTQNERGGKLEKSIYCMFS